jgi:hypothetical protein
MDKRELRLAIERKFEHRRRLISENHKVISENTRLAKKVRIADTVLRSKLANAAIDDCADEIVKMILERAFNASMLVADQVAETGDYVIGIDIPSLHIRHRIANLSLMYEGMTGSVEYVHEKHVRVSG